MSILGFIIKINGIYDILCALCILQIIIITSVILDFSSKIYTL